MSKALLVRSSLFAALALGFAGLHDSSGQSAPDLAGPSSFGHLLTVTASPDNITADGSLSSITATFVGADGQPLSGVPLQASIAVAGTPVDFGYLSSARSTRTRPARPRSSYFSPVMTGFFAGTPAEGSVGHDRARRRQLRRRRSRCTPSSRSRRLRCRCSGWTRRSLTVTYTPSAPKVGDLVVFDASTSVPAPGHSIVELLLGFRRQPPVCE